MALNAPRPLSPVTQSVTGCMPTQSDGRDLNLKEFLI